MAMNNFKIRDNGEVKSIIDLRDIVLEGLEQGDHTITIEGYLDDELITTSSKEINIASLNLDPDYQAVIDYAENNSIPVPDLQQQQEDNNIMLGLKSSGRWAIEDVFFKFTGTASSSFKLIDWKRVIKATAYGSLTWSEDGVTGNGFNGYIDTHYKADGDGIHFTPSEGSIYANVVDMFQGQLICGSRQSGSTNNRYIFFAPMYSPNGRGFFSYGAGRDGDLSDVVNGLHAMGRLDSDATSVFILSPNTYENPGTSTLAIKDLPTENLTLLARNNDDGEPDVFSTGTIKYFGIGGEINSNYENLLNLIG